MVRVYAITWFQWWNQALGFGQEYSEIGREPPYPRPFFEKHSDKVFNKNYLSLFWVHYQSKSFILALTSTVTIFLHYRVVAKMALEILRNLLRNNEKVNFEITEIEFNLMRQTSRFQVQWRLLFFGKVCQTVTRFQKLWYRKKH